MSGERETKELVLAVRDYELLAGPAAAHAAKVEDELGASSPMDQEAEGGNEGDERVHSVYITYPHEAVPLDLFLDSVMGSVLQVAKRSGHKRPVVFTNESLALQSPPAAGTILQVTSPHSH